MLHDVLDSVPSIAMSRIKEPRFFNRAVDLSSHFTGVVDDKRAYFDLWGGCPETAIRGEVTPTYFHDPLSPAAIRDTIPSVRLVLIVRNPVDRAVSHFHFKERRTGRSSLTLDEAIDLAQSSSATDYEHNYLLEPGYYGRHLERWLQFFSMEQIRILLLERVSRDFHGEMKALLSFLGAPEEESRNLQQVRSNTASLPRSPLAARLMQFSALKHVLKRLHLDRSVARLGERLLVKKAPYKKASEADMQRLVSLYRDDIKEFERHSGIATGWLADGQ